MSRCRGVELHGLVWVRQEAGDDLDGWHVNVFGDGVDVCEEAPDLVVTGATHAREVFHAALFEICARRCSRRKSFNQSRL